MRQGLALLFCIFMFTLTQAANPQDHTEKPDVKILELSGKLFHYRSDVNGKPALTLIAEPKDDWRNEKFSDYCEDTIVKLTKPEHAILIHGTSLILAFLECPASRGFEYDAVVTLFDQNDLNKPLCFSPLYLMSRLTDVRYYYYGHIDSLEVRKDGAQALRIVVTMSGADGGGYWSSLALLHMNMKCGITVLSKLYESGHCNGVCEGREFEHRFIDTKTVEVITRQFKSSKDKGKRIVKTTRKEYDLEHLYKHPGSRVFPSKTETIVAFLNSAADINTRDKEGATPLMWAVDEGALGIAEVLLNTGAKVDVKDNDGRTPLMVAAFRGYLELAKLLLAKGANIKARDILGETVLMHAAAGRNLDVKYFRRQRNGAAVVEYADSGGTIDVINLLIEKGADVNAKSAKGQTALSIASKVGLRQIVRTLEAHGAKK
jgi:hypothetical protein